jgi:hypothetical protein
MPVSRALLVYRGFEIDLCCCVASLGGFARIDRCRDMRRITRLQNIEWKTRCGLIGGKYWSIFDGSGLSDRLTLRDSSCIEVALPQRERPC